MSFSPIYLNKMSAVVHGSANSGTAASLVFEMPEHSTECFYEIVLRTDTISIEFTVSLALSLIIIIIFINIEKQVVYGGRQDVDCEVKLNDKPLYKATRERRYNWVFEASQVSRRRTVLLLL